MQRHEISSSTRSFRANASVSSRAFSTLDLDLEIWLEGINEFCEKSYEKSELKKESMNFLILVCLMNSN